MPASAQKLGSNTLGQLLLALFKHIAPWLLASGCAASVSVDGQQPTTDAAAPKDGSSAGDTSGAQRAGSGTDSRAVASPDTAPPDAGPKPPPDVPAPSADSNQPPDVTPTPDTAPNPEAAITPAQWAIIGAMSPLPAVPTDTTNKYADSPLAAALGQKLFFDKGVAAKKNGAAVNCASCHQGPMLDQGADKAGFSEYGGGGTGGRNPLGVVNSSFYKWTNWGGRFDSQWAISLAVAENPKIFNGTRLQVAHRLYAAYQADYNAAFAVPLDPALNPKAADAARFPPAGKPKAVADVDGPWETMTPADQAIINTIFANYGKAIAAYLRLCVSRNAPFDKFVAGDKTAISATAQQGLALFVGKANCVSCHSGPNFADDKFHATGMFGKEDGSDLGRFTDVAPLLASKFNTAGPYSDDTATGKLAGIQQSEALKRQFRTKSLRGVADSGPWMHSGMTFSLDDVINTYSAGGGMWYGDVKDPLLVQLNLTNEERTALHSFLKTLTGEPLPSKLLQDTAEPVVPTAVNNNVCPGGGMCPCQNSMDCDSAICLKTAVGSICAQLCNAKLGCPKDFACATTTTGSGDIVGVCQYGFDTLCDPCSKEDQCYQGTVLGKTTCVDMGNAGSFCQNLCGTNADCPAGYGCKNSGAMGNRCTPNDGGACACSQFAIDKGLSTACMVVAPKGTYGCPGVRKCLPAGVFGAPPGGGLSPCIVTVAEVPCDGVDNNCDGAVDEVQCPGGKGCYGGMCK